MTMKTTHRARHKKQAWSETNRETYRKPKWKNTSEELGTDCCEINIQRLGRPNTTNPSVPNMGTAKAIGVFRPVGKWTNYTAEMITKSSPLMIQAIQKNIPRRSSAMALTQSILLPPIKGSQMTPSEVACANTHATTGNPVKPEAPKAKLKARLSTLNLGKENTLVRLYVTGQKELNIPKSKLINDSLTIRKLQDCLKNPISRIDASGRNAGANKELNARSAVASSSAPVTLSAKRQNPDESDPNANETGAMTNGINFANRSSEAKQKEELFSDNSTIETESQSSRENDASEVIQGKRYLPEEDYYTSQRITEWVLRVNASLFSSSNDSMRSISPGQEQDTAIKIVYEGD